MLLLNDEKTRNFEINGNWIACVEYLLNKWKTSKDDVSLFLKLAVTAWYTLTLDGPELSLAKNEYEFLSKSLCETYHYFSDTLEQDTNCQWLFGYMMDVRTDLFLNCILEYKEIEQTGKSLIKNASDSRNVYAQLLFATDNCSKKEIAQFRKKVKTHISECFDDSQEVDRYFIEILTTQSV